MKNFSYYYKVNTRFYFAVLCFFYFVAIVFANKTFASSPIENQKNELRQKMNTIQVQINNYRQNIADIKQQNKTLKRDILLMDAEIDSIGLQIEKIGLAVEETEAEIADTDINIAMIESRTDQEKKILTQYIRIMYDFDQQDLLATILTSGKLSDVFERVSAFQDVQQKIQESMVSVKQMRADLEADRADLENKRGELNQLSVLQQIQKQSLIAQEDDKKDLLVQTKGQEGNYQKLMTKAQSDAASIKKSLYLLEGIGLSMPLEEAYQYAKKASDETGVRPAFLLAVLKNESSWGEKPGTGFWRQDMNAKDKDAFVQICESLNLDPDKMPVSRKPSYGWGGAMGPAQFLPSVWLQYKTQIARLTGHRTPNPWNIEDAFAAASLKLAQAGADSNSTDAEWKAAQIYFAGNNWNNSTYYFYGDQVMDMADIIQYQLEAILT